MGSMTQRMQALSERCFEIKQISQTWQRPRASEAKRLALSKYSSLQVREVYLLCDNEICMFARSLFTVDALFGRGWQLQYLGDKPLGALLFKDPRLARGAFEFALLHAGDEDYEKASADLLVKPPTLWARRSIFYWQQKELLVQEVFLPQLLNRIQC